jgi:hypothetical protein
MWSSLATRVDSQEVSRPALAGPEALVHAGPLDRRGQVYSTTNVADLDALMRRPLQWRQRAGPLDRRRARSRHHARSEGAAALSAKRPPPQNATRPPEPPRRKGAVPRGAVRGQGSKEAELAAAWNQRGRERGRPRADPRGACERGTPSRAYASLPNRLSRGGPAATAPTPLSRIRRLCGRCTAGFAGARRECAHPSRASAALRRQRVVFERAADLLACVEAVAADPEIELARARSTLVPGLDARRSGGFRCPARTDPARPS